MKSHLRFLSVVVSMMTGVVGLAVVNLGRNQTQLTNGSAAIVAITSTLCLLVFLWLESSRGISFVGYYAFALWVFHFGLSFTVWRSGESMSELSTLWLQLERGRLLLAYGMALLGFATTCIVGAAVPPPTDPRLDTSLIETYSTLGRLLGAVGAFLFLLMLPGRGGLGALNGNYLDFIMNLPGLLAAVSFLSLGAGAILHLGFRPIDVRDPFTILFGLMAVVMLRIGFRGEVMMPALAAVALKTFINPARRMGWTWAAFGVALSLIPALRVLRLARSGGDVARSISAVDGAAELGFTIRPVAVAVRWVEGSGFRGGSTYLESISRLMANFGLADASSTPLDVEVLAKEGPIGFSPIAEAYINFGLTGVVVWCGVVALLLRWLERRAAGSTAWLAFCALVLNVLLYQVRNSFAQVPFQVMVSGLIAAGGLFALRAISSNRPFSRSRGNSPDRALMRT